MTTTTAEKVAPRLKERYRSEVIPKLNEQFSFANPMQVPRLVKIVVTMGVGEAARDAKLIDGAVRDLATITGQKPQVRRATKSIAQFKLREGMPIGAKVTLRNDRPRGMDITVVTTASNDEEGRALLRKRGFPFKEA